MELIKPQISVVIPLTTDSKYVTEVLQVLDLQAQVNFEVLLVLNPASSNWPRLASHFSFPIMRLHSAKGANQARNEGLRKAQSDLVLFLDSDCVPARLDFLARYVELMNQHPHLTGVGGRYSLFPEANSMAQTYNFLQMQWVHEGLYNAQNECLNLLGGNLVLRKSLLKDELFDANLIFGGTERELLQRLHQQGHRFAFFENQVVYHYGNLNLIQLLKKAFAQGRGARYIQEKLGRENRSFINLKPISAPREHEKSIYYYRLFFELGFQKGLAYQIRKIWNSLLISTSQIFSIAYHAQSIKDRKDS